MELPAFEGRRAIASALVADGLGDGVDPRP
jgi:hypothetical protein